MLNITISFIKRYDSQVIMIIVTCIVLVVQFLRLVGIRFRIFLLIKIHKNLVLHSRMLLFLVLRKRMLILSLRSRIMLLSEVMQIRL